MKTYQEWLKNYHLDDKIVTDCIKEAQEESPECEDMWCGYSDIRLIQGKMREVDVHVYRPEVSDDEWSPEGDWLKPTLPKLEILIYDTEDMKLLAKFEV